VIEKGSDNIVISVILKLAEKCFPLGVFAIGLVVINAGLFVSPSEMLDSTELLVLTVLGCGILGLSAWLWVKSNDTEHSMYGPR